MMTWPDVVREIRWGRGLEWDDAEFSRLFAAAVMRERAAARARGGEQAEHEYLESLKGTST